MIITMITDNSKRDEARSAFSQRLNSLLNYYNAPGKHEGRQVLLSKKMGVSQEAARKWLEGESIPREDKIIQLCQIYPCRKSWLQHGEGEMVQDATLDEIMELTQKLNSDARQTALQVLRGLAAAAK